MNDNKFCKGVVIGAIAGGLVTLLDRNTRYQVWNTLKQTQTTTRYYIKNPSEAFHSVREGYESLSTELSNGVSGTLTILNQIQDTLEKVTEVQTEEIDQNNQTIH